MTLDEKKILAEQFRQALFLLLNTQTTILSEE